MIKQDQVLVDKKEIKPEALVKKERQELTPEQALEQQLKHEREQAARAIKDSEKSQVILYGKDKEAPTHLYKPEIGEIDKEIAEEKSNFLDISKEVKVLKEHQEPPENKEDESQLISQKLIDKNKELLDKVNKMIESSDTPNKELLKIKTQLENLTDRNRLEELIDYHSDLPIQQQIEPFVKQTLEGIEDTIDRIPQYPIAKRKESGIEKLEEAGFIPEDKMLAAQELLQKVEHINNNLEVPNSKLLEIQERLSNLTDEDTLIDLIDPTSPGAPEDQIIPIFDATFEEIQAEFEDTIAQLDFKSDAIELFKQPIQDIEVFGKDYPETENSTEAEIKEIEQAKARIKELQFEIDDNNNPNCYKTKISNNEAKILDFAQRIDHLENQVIKIETGYYDEQTQKAENQNKKRKGDNQPLKPIEESPVLIDIVNQIKTFKEQQKKFVQEVNQFRAEQQNKTDERNNLQNQVADFYDNKIDPVEGKLSDLRTNGLENGHGNFEGVKKIYSQLKKELDEAKPPIEELKNEIKFTKEEIQSIKLDMKTGEKPDLVKLKELETQLLKLNQDIQLRETKQMNIGVYESEMEQLKKEAAVFNKEIRHMENRKGSIVGLGQSKEVVEKKERNVKLDLQEWINLYHNEITNEEARQELAFEANVKKGFFKKDKGPKGPIPADILNDKKSTEDILRAVKEIDDQDIESILQGYTNQKIPVKVRLDIHAKLDALFKDKKLKKFEVRSIKSSLRSAHEQARAEAARIPSHIQEDPQGRPHRMRKLGEKKYGRKSDATLISDALDVSGVQQSLAGHLETAGLDEQDTELILRGYKDGTTEEIINKRIKKLSAEKKLKKRQVDLITSALEATKLRTDIDERINRLRKDGIILDKEQAAKIIKNVMAGIKAEGARKGGIAKLSTHETMSTAKSAASLKIERILDQALKKRGADNLPPVPEWNFKTVRTNTKGEKKKRGIRSEDLEIVDFLANNPNLDPGMANIHNMGADDIKRLKHLTHKESKALPEHYDDADNPLELVGAMKPPQLSEETQKTNITKSGESAKGDAIETPVIVEHGPAGSPEDFKDITEWTKKYINSAGLGNKKEGKMLQKVLSTLSPDIDLTLKHDTANAADIIAKVLFPKDKTKAEEEAIGIQEFLDMKES